MHHKSKENITTVRLTSNSTVKIFSGNLIPEFLVSLLSCKSWNTSKSDNQAEEEFWTSMKKYVQGFPSSVWTIGKELKQYRLIIGSDFYLM